MAAALQNGGNHAAQMDFGAICVALAYQSVDEMINCNPDVLLRFSSYSRRELREMFRVHCAEFALSPEDRRMVEGSVMELFIKSLRNSSYTAIVETLERNVRSYMPMTTKEGMKRLIREARSLLSASPKKNLESIQGNLKKLRETVAKINDVMALFFYCEPKNQEAIDLLIAHTTDGRQNPIFSACDSHFDDFIGNLKSREKEKGRLVRQHQSLLKKIDELRKKESALMGAGEVLDPRRKRLFENFAIPFWEAGTRILERAFRMTFQEKWETGSYLPEYFKGAVCCAARGAQNFHLMFDPLLQRIPQDLPEPYLHHVWLNFLGRESPMADVNDLMKLILKRLPGVQLIQLETGLRTSQDRRGTILRLFLPFLNAQMAEGTTFPRLKDWIG